MIGWTRVSADVSHVDFMTTKNVNETEQNRTWKQKYKGDAYVAFRGRINSFGAMGLIFREHGLSQT